MTAIAAIAGEFHAFLIARDDGDPAFDIETTTAKLDRSGLRSQPLFSALIAEMNDNPLGYSLCSIGFCADPFEGMVWLTDLFVREAWGSRDRRAAHAPAGCDRQKRGSRNGDARPSGRKTRRQSGSKRFYDQLGSVALADQRAMKWAISSAGTA
jgi:hypothetical protein